MDIRINKFKSEVIVLKIIIEEIGGFGETEITIKCQSISD